MNKISPVVRNNSIEELMPREPINTHNPDRRESIWHSFVRLGMTGQFVCESAGSVEVDWELLVRGTDAGGRHSSGRLVAANGNPFRNSPHDTADTDLLRLNQSSLLPVN
jgi:hypothetical protein